MAWFDRYTRGLLLLATKIWYDVVIAILPALSKNAVKLGLMLDLELRCFANIPLVMDNQ